MSILKLSLQNFKKSFSVYLSLILSLAFSVLVLFNFQNIIYSNAFESLGAHNKDYIDMIIQVISFVLICFLFFFIWYSTNVFLTKRKKEIGIYVFMGLNNQKIGRMYALETICIGIASLFLGLILGIMSSYLFQMIILAISDIAIEIDFRFTLTPVLITGVVYFLIYFIFVIKGYVNIVRSSVLSLISATKQNEYVKQKSWTLIWKTVLGSAILVYGYILAIKDGHGEVLTNALLATVLVVVGTYLIFGGLLPLIFQFMAKRKHFLYQKERTLWINNTIFRMKKNYRTYAIVCVLMICAVTALACSFAMKNQYEKMVHFRNTYTYQILSNHSDLEEEVRKRIEKENTITYRSEISILNMDDSLLDTPFIYSSYAVLSYSEVKKLAEDAGMDFQLEEPGDEEYIDLARVYLLSLYTDKSGFTITIDGNSYQQIDETNAPYLGYLQEQMSFFIVNERVYEQLKPLGGLLYCYNYAIEDRNNYEASLGELDGLVSNTDEDYIGRVAINPNSSDIEWIKVMYSICVFMFMVFLVASGSILFMKLYNDSFEDIPRYQVLHKLGFSDTVINRSISKELIIAYAAPFIFMSISSYFSVHALEKMMRANLVIINVVSVSIVFICFLVFYLLSVKVYKNIVKGT